MNELPINKTSLQQIDEACFVDDRAQRGQLCVVRQSTTE